MSEKTRATNWAFTSDLTPKSSTQKTDFTDPKAAHEYKRVPRPFAAPFTVGESLLLFACVYSCSADASTKEWESQTRSTFRPPVSERTQAFKLGPELRASHWALGSDRVVPESTHSSDFRKYEASRRTPSLDIDANESNLPFAKGGSARSWVSHAAATYTPQPESAASPVDMKLRQTHFVVGTDPAVRFETTHRTDFGRPEHAQS